MFKWIRAAVTDHYAYRSAIEHLKNAGFNGDIAEAIERLYSYRVTIALYRQWLSEFPDVATVLDNLHDETESISPFLDACHPPGPKGPWVISSLREVLRARHAAPKKDQNAGWLPFVPGETKLVEDRREYWVLEHVDPPLFGTEHYQPAIGRFEQSRIDYNGNEMGPGFVDDCTSIARNYVWYQEIRFPPAKLSEEQK